ncbi:uncharacterized protein LOC113791071 [Dermatophagoides pteronyssinus]|uniref:uncharacterized protein LOC113791071 n=1 Tax=Dermatophagoides pteronyssinus TaxID=6956 RepID=UPI003F668166
MAVQNFYQNRTKKIMGLSSAARGHMRPFGGRSPPFLVATLCVGLCVLGVSYWRLGIQYNDLESQLLRLIQKKNSLEADVSFINKQLESREENFSKAKVNLQNTENDLINLKNQFDEQSEKLKTMQKTNENFEHSMDDQRKQLEAKETIVSELRKQNQALLDENQKLKSDYTEVKSRLDSTSKLSNKNVDDSNSNSNSKAQQQLQTNNMEQSKSINVIHSPPSLNNNQAASLSKSSSLPSSMDSNKNIIPAPGIVAEAQSSQSQAIPETAKEQPPQQNSDQKDHSNEQIQKPKIDPVIKLIKNNVGLLDNNDHQRQPKSAEKFDNGHQNDKSMMFDNVDNDGNNLNGNDGGGGDDDGGNNGGGKMIDDKDALLDSNNIDDNNNTLL